MSRIPEIMTSVSGEKISTVEAWEKFRRPEIINLFENYEYGVRDIERPENLKFELKAEKNEHGMRVKYLEASFNDYSFPFRLYLPQNQDKPLPALIHVMHEFQEDGFVFDKNGNMSAAPEITKSVLPLKYITDRGFACAVMPTRNIYPDWKAHAEFKQGVFSAYKSAKPRNKHSWATISAWAWGVERVIDYLEKDGDIDSSKIAVNGHSRGGKTALWASAIDKRILLSVPNNSGCCGAAVLRGKKGEHAVDINDSGCDWFCEKFRDFDNCEEFLPLDQHMLVASIAPRYVYITGSTLDEWADPDAEFLSAKLATEAFELYGVSGLVAPEKPIVNEVYQKGHIAFHLKEGEHSQTMFDWEKVLDYFEKICKEN